MSLLCAPLGPHAYRIPCQWGPPGHSSHAVNCWCKALSLKSLDWSSPNTRFYNETFTRHAWAILWCSYYLQEDHFAQSCPKNPSHSWFQWLQEASLVPPALILRMDNSVGMKPNMTENVGYFQRTTYTWDHIGGTKGKWVIPLLKMFWMSSLTTASSSTVKLCQRALHFSVSKQWSPTLDDVARSKEEKFNPL